MHQNQMDALVHPRETEIALDTLDHRRAEATKATVGPIAPTLGPKMVEDKPMGLDDMAMKWMWTSRRMLTRTKWRL